MYVHNLNLIGDGGRPNITLYREQLENVKTLKYNGAMLNENEMSKKVILI